MFYTNLNITDADAKSRWTHHYHQNIFRSGMPISFTRMYTILVGLSSLYVLTGQVTLIINCIQTRHWENAQLSVHIHVFRSSFYVSASDNIHSYVRLKCNAGGTWFICPRRNKTSYVPRVKRPLNVRGTISHNGSLWPQSLCRPILCISQ